MTGVVQSSLMVDLTERARQTETIRFGLESPGMSVEIERLVDTAFGPGRLAKTAERLRERNQHVANLGLCATDRERVIGSVRLWPVRIGETPALFLGPIVVDAEYQSRGLGAELVRQACDRALDAGHHIVLLVGDHAFFGPLGFDVAPIGRVQLPGPVNPVRLLWRSLRGDAVAGCSGRVSVA